MTLVSVVLILLVAILVNAGPFPVVTTWNVGLEEKYNTQRTPAVIAALNGTNEFEDADFVCLQEVWGGPARIKTVINAVNAKYPYYWTLVDNAYITGTSGTSFTPPCPISSITKDIPSVASCINAQNLECTLTNTALYCLLPCLLNVFKNLMTPLTNPCWGCLLEQAYAIYSGEKRDLNALADCETDTSQPWIQTLGLVVLSKYPFSEIQQGYYQTFLAPRGYVSITIPTWNNTLFTCTHFPVIQPLIPYVSGLTTNFTSWDQENLAAAQTLVGILNSMNISQNFPNQLTMGDFNHSPNITSQDVQALDLPAFLTINGSYGARNLYVERQLECTACPNNVIAPENPPAVLDHIWMKGSWWTSDTSQFVTYQIWNQTINISLYGSCTPSQLSDHYSVHLLVPTGTLNTTETRINVCAAVPISTYSIFFIGFFLFLLDLSL